MGTGSLCLALYAVASVGFAFGFLTAAIFSTGDRDDD